MSGPRVGSARPVIIDFLSEKAKRDAATQERVASLEAAFAILRPYASMDELPDIDIRGQIAVREAITKWPR